MNVARGHQRQLGVDTCLVLATTQGPILVAAQKRVQSTLPPQKKGKKEGKKERENKACLRA